MGNLNTKKIATGGILLALSIATLFGAAFIPGIELTLYALSTVYVAVMVIEYTPNTGWLFYFGSVMITWLIVPNKAALLPYTVFFGIYAMFKYYIEHYLRKLPQFVQIILKLTFCNIMFLFGFFFFSFIFIDALHVPDVSMPLIIIGAQVFFLTYDYILTLLIGFYLKKVRKQTNSNMRD